MMFRGILALCCLTPILTSAEPEGAALSWEDAGCKLLGSMKDVMDCSLTQTDGLLTHVPTGIPVSVQHLWLTDNQIGVLGASDLDGLVNLKYLYLENNEIMLIEEGAFDSLASLFMVLLNGNRLTALPHSLFAATSKLTYIDLQNNMLTIVTASTFDGLVSIKHLNIYDNQVNEIECGAFNHVETATYFNMGSNPSSCAIDIWDAHLRCECDQGSDGSTGHCSTTQACALKPPVFHDYTLQIPATETSETSTTHTTITQLPAKRVVGNYYIDSNASLVQEETQFASESKGSDKTAMIGGVAGCLVVVVAMFGVAVYSRKKNSMQMRNTTNFHENTSSHSSESEWRDEKFERMDSDYSTEEAITVVSKVSHISGRPIVADMSWDPTTIECKDDEDYSEIEQDIAALSACTDT
eukprot:m.106094 g.106094  ORF g.106094 m.106094 type:complete len:411 (+) comp27700_c0_seq1:160-1392(+)